MQRSSLHSLCYRKSRVAIKIAKISRPQLPGPDKPSPCRKLLVSWMLLVLPSKSLPQLKAMSSTFIPAKFVLSFRAIVELKHALEENGVARGPLLNNKYDKNDVSCSTNLQYTADCRVWLFADLCIHCCSDYDYIGSI